MADRSYRGGRQDRDRNQGYSRQAEQFESDNHGWREDERGYGQMGETIDREDYGQFDVSGQSYSRDRDFSRERDRGGRAAADPSGPYSPRGFGPARYRNNENRGFASFTSNDYGGADFAGPRYHYAPGRSPYTRYGAFGAGGYGEGSYGAAPRREYGAGYEAGWSNSSNDPNERGFFERAGDEIASWFGDEDASRRREQDHSGRGPSGYTRSDERILEDTCDTLTRDWRIDASNVQVTVKSGEVTLDGTVGSRSQKRRAEDIVDDLSGVKHVQNNLRVHEESAWDRNNTGGTAAGRNKAS